MRLASFLRFLPVLAICLGIAAAAGPTRASEEEQQPGAGESAGPSFVNVPWLPAPIMRNGVVVSYMIFEVRLQVASEGEAEEVRVQMPRLRDAFLRVLNKETMVKKDGSGKLDFEMISRRLKDSANKVMGEEKVDQVVIVKAVRSAA